MKSEAYLNEIRGVEGLKRAVLSKIVVDGRDLVFHLVTDCNYTQGDVAKASAISQRYAPAGYTAQVRVVKSVPSEEGVRRAIYDFLRLRYPAAAAFLTPADVSVTVDGAGGRYVITAAEAERPQFAVENVLDALTKELSRRFCGTWLGDFRFVEREMGEIEREAPPPAELVYAPRFFPVTDYEAIDGEAGKTALYIADLNKEMQGVTVCGRVTFIEERETKSGKPYFSISITDGTGVLRAAYFSKKKTIEKVRSLAQGANVCLTGDNELYNGGLSFRAKAVDFGAPPEGFVPEARPSRPVPAQYKAVFPTPAADYVQARLFDETPLPEIAKTRDFVVFDLETTGLNSTGAGGMMDRIIEIGAVKIKNGQITEKFSSFVACPVRLTDEIVSLTGITDQMLVGAPETADVIADFYRFCDGCTLVAHNAAFDSKFVRYYGEKEGYLFEHPQIDTVAFAQEALRLSNYKLNTVADHFGFTFNHHRAFDDAFVTAKIFLELVKLKKGLPA